MAGLLIIAHAPLASALRAVAGHVYPEGLARVQSLDVPPDWGSEQTQAQAQQLLAQNGLAPTLVLVDVCGATPCNAALALAQAEPDRLHVVAGVSVPMLWRALCYAGDDLDTLTARVLEGGQRGVTQIWPDPGQPPLKPPCTP